MSWGTRSAAVSWPPRSVVGSCPSCRRRSRTGRAASRASRSPATRRPTAGSSAPTAHRRFGLTLNLNDGYQGGQLRFPEYGPELYRPAAGAGLLFSCSHLHDVLDVTAGRRFVLLSFLFGEEGAPRPE